jgi:hypothetical protein
MFVNFVVMAILLLIPAWRIFGKAGLEPAFALVIFIPFAGPLIAMAILVFANWPNNGGAAGTEPGGG